MSTNIPAISVTTDAKRYHHHVSTSGPSDSEDNSDSYSNDMDYNQNLGGGVTDVEDFDSQVDFDRPHSRRSSKNSLALPKATANTSGDATDVEDYNDSDADEDEDKSSVYPELKLSLEEFLQNDAKEHLSTSNGVQETVEHKTGNFLQAQNLNEMHDYLTDCEDYNTDSELENNCEKSVCCDLNETFAEQGRVNIADVHASSMDQQDSEDDYDDVSVASDISDMASALADDNGKEQHGMSEDELLELSGNEEICQISCSEDDSAADMENNSEEDLLSSVSLPPIDVTFIKTPHGKMQQKIGTFGAGTSGNKGDCKKMFLEVANNNKEEVLTDIERFDDSVAEDGDNDSFDADDQQPIPQAVILAVGDEGDCMTDCEDLMYDDLSEAPESTPSIDVTALPLPQREVVMLQEDKYGDTISSVMPMDSEYQFGIPTILKDECVTDTEEYSGAEDYDIQVSLAEPPSCSRNDMVEPDVTVANEVMKHQQSKRLEILSNTESVTDVEEIFMAGTNSRKKKLKTRSMSKGKSKFLETPKTRDDGGGTDIEDMDLSETGLPDNLKSNIRPQENPIQNNTNAADKVTDIEDISADDMSSVSEADIPQIKASTSNLRDYENSSQNIVVTLETCGSATCTKHKKSTSTSYKLREDITIHNQPHTDIEDVQLPSDAEECMNDITSSACICHELNEMLNASCTTVHEKCSNNSFNVDAEKLHIKGMMLGESHTDIEYVESDESAARGSK